MKLIYTKTLTDVQQRDLLALNETCKKHDRISLSFPMEQDCALYLLYDEGFLLSALCSFFNEDGDCQCYAFTLPEKRKQGHFTRLLKELLKKYQNCDLIFPAEEKCKDALLALQAVGADFLYKEYVMELNFEDFEKAGSVQAKPVSDGLSVISVPSEFAGSDVFWFKRKNKIIGSCFLNTENKNPCLYSFEIEKTLRGLGLGRACLLLFLETFFRMPENREKRLLLQVSGDNEAAVKLYQKTGFQIRESLSFYIY